uniref:Uncharacterized protein n=1 Tax=Sphaerodactylus townsendi TaxID=933632 RepID=A0ACB8E816_9SAUR
MQETPRFLSRVNQRVALRSLHRCVEEAGACSDLLGIPESWEKSCETEQHERETTLQNSQAGSSLRKKTLQHLATQVHCRNPTVNPKNKVFLTCRRRRPGTGSMRQPTSIADFKMSIFPPVPIQSPREHLDVEETRCPSPALARMHLIKGKGAMDRYLGMHIKGLSKQEAAANSLLHFQMIHSGHDSTRIIAEGTGQSC